MSDAATLRARASRLHHDSEIIEIDIEILCCERDQLRRERDELREELAKISGGFEARVATRRKLRDELERRPWRQPTVDDAEVQWAVFTGPKPGSVPFTGPGPASISALGQCSIGDMTWHFADADSEADAEEIARGTPGAWVARRVVITQKWAPVT